MKLNADDPFCQRAAQLARKSTLLQQHGCVIVKDNRIVSEGHNHYTQFPMAHAFSIHSEIDALSKIKRRGRKYLEACTLIVVRIAKNNNEMKMSMPCAHCMRALNQCGIGRVLYSS